MSISWEAARERGLIKGLEELFWDNCAKIFYWEDKEGAMQHVEPRPLAFPQPTDKPLDFPSGANAYCVGCFDRREVAIQFYYVSELDKSNKPKR